MNVLVIFEDFRKDQYLQPIIEAIFAALDRPGKPKAKVQICRDPLLQGISQALKWENMDWIVEHYPMVNIFLLCVDRDCQIGRRAELDHLENKVKTETLLKPNQVFLGECAWQELEVWILAGHHDFSWEWKAIRQDCNPKETYYLPYAKQRNVAETLGDGRKILGQEAAKNYSRLRQLCPEDIGRLEQRFGELLLK